MPKSKVRKKVKQARSNTNKVPREVMTVPVWEYPSAARQMAVEMEGEMTVAECLDFLLLQPIRFDHPEKQATSTFLPAMMAQEAGVSLAEWMESFTALHEEGFMQWNDKTMTHYPTTPSKKEQ